MSDPSASTWGATPPPDEWLTAVNRQSLAVRLLATTVHDVNNILQVVSGAAEVLALDPTPAAVAKRTTSIVGQSAAATAVMQALMAFVRAEGGSRDGARPLALAHQALTFRQHAFKKLRLAAEADGDDVECAMTRPRLQQVLLNLVLNAEQALANHQAGVLRVTVRGGAMVTITVTDNGAGLSDTRRAAIDAWPPSPGGAAGSLGIGLRVVQTLVAQAGGTLRLDAQAEGGTAAVVTLPAVVR